MNVSLCNMPTFERDQSNHFQTQIKEELFDEYSHYEANTGDEEQIKIDQRSHRHSTTAENIISRGSQNEQSMLNSMRSPSEQVEASQMQNTEMRTPDQVSINIDQNEIVIDELISVDEREELNKQGSNCLKEENEVRIRRKFRSGSRHSKKNRKIRTTITKQKLIQMNRIFAEYSANREEGKNPKYNLKEIGQQLHLGYSTILHKYRQFRATKKVKGGALIASLQKKRKYRKSVEIERIIQKALGEQPFYTAVELSKYIMHRFGRPFSRSIISRHLGQMGYSYKNLKSTPIQKNRPKYKEVRKIYAHMLQPLILSNEFNQNVIYVDEMACALSTFIKKKGSNSELKKSENMKEEQYVTLMVAANCNSVIYYQVYYGFPNRTDFCNALQTIKRQMLDNRISTHSKTIIITDLNKIHRDSNEDEDESVRYVMQQLNIQRYFLPPSSPQLNPLESIFHNIKNKINKRDISTIEQLSTQILNLMQKLNDQSVEIHFKELPIWIQKSKREQNF